jgi:hypothetical protein
VKILFELLWLTLCIFFHHLLLSKNANWGTVMAYGIEAAKMVSLDRVFLDTHNPRHKPFEGEPETIAFLCKTEHVLALAEDIAAYGLNPLELFALISDDGGDTYFVAEGNRRLCALLLLNDPNRAPADLHKRFAKAAEAWTPITEIFAVVFPNRDQVRIWLDRIHAGPDNGRGRRSWDSEQKARNTAYSKNDLAQAILDVATKYGFINEKERKGRISTVQKYLANPDLRKSIGLVNTDPDNLMTDLSVEDTAKSFGTFIRDVAERKIYTRSGRRAEDIVGYAGKLIERTGLSGQRVSPRSFTSLGKGGAKPKAKKKSIPSQPKKRANVPHDASLEGAIRAIPSYKLEHLYYSLTSIPLEPHTPLLYVAAWSLLESLTRAHGSTTDFQSYLNKVMLDGLGFPKGDLRTSLTQALRRVSEYGNSTKHDHIAAAFNGLQLSNDIEVLTPLLIKLATEVK